jgi:putative uncharacterized protein CPE1289
MSNVNNRIEEKLDFTRAKCDKYDYMIAASCGVLAGLVDVFFVGAPGDSKLQGVVDKGTDELVKKAAKMFYQFDSRATGKPKHAPETLEQCISYLEQAFPVPYDARYAKDLKLGDGMLDGMWSGNHHLYSLGHSPDPIGLIFSIIDQFTNMGSYIDHGKIIRVEPKKTSGAIPYLQGTNVISRLFCGFVNWIGHIISDLAGSSSTRAQGKTGRGSGIQMPFYELFLFCNFGNIDGNTISELAIKAFEEGYDVRFGATMAIPVVLNDIFIRVIWALKSHFYGKREWKQCIPTQKHDDLRIMLLVGNGALCLVDGADALIRSGGNPLAFVLRMNLIAWAKFALSVLRELKIRYHYAIDDLSRPFEELQEAISEYLQELEKIDIKAFVQETESYQQLSVQLDKVNNEEELHTLLMSNMEALNIPKPWKGDFNEFMSNKKNHLEFL